MYSEEDEAKAEELIKEAEIKKEDESSDESSDENAETPDEKGQRKIELEDLQLWKSMDLNKDGKLTIAEYERLVSSRFLTKFTNYSSRFSRSPGAQKFVRNMKEHKAVEQWAASELMSKQR